MKRVTKATVTAALKKIDTEGLTVEVDSETVTFWYDSADEASTEKAREAAKAICDATGASTTMNNGSKMWVSYKRAPVDMGDYNDKSSRWHY